MATQNLTKELVVEAIGQTDGTIKSAAAFLQVPYRNVAYYICKYKIPFNNKNKINATPEQLYKSYLELQSLRDVALKFNCTGEGVRTVLKKHGYEINELVIHSFNELFFESNSEESFYWAGFIAADGCVKSRKSSKINIRYELSIGLALSDKDHLIKFKNCINYTGKIGEYLVKNSNKNSTQNKYIYKDSYKAEISITSKKIFDSLARFNIVPRKSLIYTFPEWLIDHPMVHHFMRGYFDGDGSIYTILKENRTTEQKYFNILGTEQFLTQYRTILENNCESIIKREKPPRKINNIYALEYGGNTVLSEIGKFIYKDANIYLDRKRIKFNV